MATKRPKSSFVLRMSPKLKVALEQKAAAEDRSLNSYMIQLAKKVFENEIESLRDQLKAYEERGMRLHSGKRDISDAEKRRIRERLAELEKMLAG